MTVASKSKQVALRTCLIYALVAGSWILLSDRAVVTLVSDPELIGRLSTFKGWAFVVVTAFLLYGLLRGQLGSWEKESLRRHAAESELRLAQEKYRQIFEHSVEGTYQTTPQGSFLAANPAMARILGYDSPEELIRNRTDLSRQGYVNPRDREEFKRRIEAQGIVNDFEYEAWRKDGTTVWLEESARVVRDENGQVLYYEGSMRDISERRRAEAEREKLQEQLTQAQKMESVGRLAGGIAHDFNNMLTAIQGNASLALAELPPNSPLREHLEQIQQCTQRSAELTRQLLAFARKQTVLPRVLDLSTTVSGLLKMLHRLIGEDIELVWRPCASPCVVKLDPSQLDQILTNLCVNARDAISGVGRLTLETRCVSFDESYCAAHAGAEPGDFVELAVRDNGCGMSKEVLAHLFEPFFTTKPVGQGTGLGLATVYGIIKQNRGFIEVESAPGEGTTFKVYLPRFSGHGSPSPAGTQDVPTERGHETVMVVEDEPTILRVAKLALEGMGYRVLVADTPGEAIRLAEEHAGEIHLLLTDVVMPEMNGRDLAKRLLSLYPNLRRVFMSGYTANVIAPHGVMESGVHFLQKPFSSEELASKVRAALDEAV